MKYTFQDKTGKERTINIDENEIKSLMKIYKISMNEALELYLFDNDYIENDYVNELTAKAKANGNMRVQGATARKPRQRKPDEDKRNILAAIEYYLNSEEFAGRSGRNVKDVTRTNIERIIFFSLGDDKYELTLSKKRKPKD